MTTRVFLIDDHHVLREGLRLLIDAQPDMKVVGESEVGRGVTQKIETIGGADVVVLDISMPDESGAHVASELGLGLPSARIVVLTRHAEKAYVQQMLGAGASGYVLKQTSADVLIAAIRSVVNGGTFLDPAIAGKVLESGTPPLRGHPSEAVTAREREVLTLVAYGHTNKEIAAILGITVKTIESHKTNAMRKLEISSRAELVRFALTEGWLEDR